MRRLITILALFTILSTESLVAQTRVSADEVRQSVTRYLSDKLPNNEEQGSVTVVYVERQSANIQTIRWRHNLRVGIAVPSLTSALILDRMLYSDYELRAPANLSEQLASARYYSGPERLLSNLSLEYAYAVKSWLHIGGKLVFSGYFGSRRSVITDEVLYRDNTYYGAALFNVRFEWLRRKSVQMYSAVGAGVVSRVSRGDTYAIPMFDATYLGLSVGRGFYGFVELGGGASGSIRAGVGCRFNSKK